MNLYQVLLVDNERFITASLLKSIPWEKYQCSVYASASNGLEALEIIEKQQIDIVITDIRMQQMGGLELCQILYAQYPRIQVIVISGYAEFSYAQRAIRYGILGYCLKPLEYEEIGFYLTRAVSRLNESSRSYSQDDLLNALFAEDIPAISRYLESVGLISASYFCSVFSGSYPPCCNPSTEVLISLGKQQYGLFSSRPLDPQRIDDFLKVAGNHCVGLSEHPVPLTKLPACMKECQIKAFHYFIQPDCKIKKTLSDENSQALLNQFASQIALANSEQLLHMLNELKNTPQRDLFSVRTAMRLNNMICSSSSYSMQEDNYYLYSIQQMLDRYRNFHALIDNLRMLIMNPRPHQTENSQITNLTVIKMMDFLNSNYCLDISTNTLAEHMHLSPGYVSKIFRQEIGTTVTKYITNLRILKAKQMLNAGKCSISEIAAATGFNDYFYFLKTFKKVTGQTPHQYQSDQKSPEMGI